MFVLHRAPQPFDENVVDGPAIVDDFGPAVPVDCTSHDLAAPLDR